MKGKMDKQGPEGNSSGDWEKGEEKGMGGGGAVAESVLLLHLGHGPCSPHPCYGTESQWRKSFSPLVLSANLNLAKQLMILP